MDWEAEGNKVRANPTKDFFISMLVRDIGLINAIIDLADNSVDGARRLNSTDYGGRFIRLEFDNHSFKISDNCGGIPIEIARDYAFCFGRPENAPDTPHSVGQFGVGMKRALFKIGSKFTIKSKSEKGSFELQVDVSKWREVGDWEFEFSQKDEESENDETGTSIEVSDLYPGIATEFDLEAFESKLKATLENAHQQAIQLGMGISVNGTDISFRESELLVSEDIRPAFQEISYSEPSPTVKVKIYTGISESDPEDSGWYVYCNGRAILEADKSQVTGWGEGSDTTIPKYHNQFARFRGYAFFDCDSAKRLPWNTTKTGVDTGSAIWRATRLVMLKQMRPVVDFLNQLDKEKDASAERPLSDAVEAAEAKPLEQLELSGFVAPRPEAIKKAPRERTISYKKPIERIKIALDILGAASFKEVGERTFDYFYERECSE